MLQTLKKFFNFCGEDNRKLFTAAIWLGVLSAICTAMRIPAAYIVIVALLENNVTTTVEQPCHCGGIGAGEHRHQYEVHHAPDPGRIPNLR